MCYSRDFWSLTSRTRVCRLVCVSRTGEHGRGGFPERDRLLFRGVPSVGSSLFLGTTELRCVCGVRSGRSNIDGGVSKGILLADLSLFAEHLWDCKTSRRLALPDPQGSASGMIILCGISTTHSWPIFTASAGRATSECFVMSSQNFWRYLSTSDLSQSRPQAYVPTSQLPVSSECGLNVATKHKKPERLTSPR